MSLPKPDGRRPSAPMPKRWCARGWFPLQDVRERLADIETPAVYGDDDNRQ